MQPATYTRCLLVETVTPPSYDSLLLLFASRVQTSHNQFAAHPFSQTHHCQPPTQSLQELQKNVADTMNNLEGGFPGPLVNDVLDVIKTQSEASADEIKQVFDNLSKDYPNLDPKTLMNGVEATLEELLSGSEGPLQLALLTATDPSAAAKELTGQIPVAFQAVNDALVGSQGVVKAMLPAELGDVNAPVDLLRSSTPQEAAMADELQQVSGHSSCQPIILSWSIA
jgi:hypothetical protein